MLQATGSAATLWSQASSVKVTSGATGKGVHDGGQRFAVRFHALFMAGTFGILLPLGVIYLRVLEKVMWHAFNQAFAVVVVLIGGVLGIYCSRLYNKASAMATMFEHVNGLFSV